MKRSLLFTWILLISITTIAQPPQSFKYQAVIRNNAGEILQNQNVGIRISIRHASAGGAVVYRETFSETTNNFGLVNLGIGTGTPSIGTFSAINWGNGAKFIQTEVDVNGGVNYVTLGAAQLASVPYALYDGDWITSGNNIYAANSGNIGIKTTSPNAPLHVDDRIRVGEDLSYGTVYGELIHEGSSSGFKINANANGSWANMYLQTDGVSRLSIKSNGNVGIGTTDPGAGLHVKGSSFPGSFMFLEAGTGNDAGFRLYEGSTPKWHLFNNSASNGLQIYNSSGSKTVFFAHQTTGNVGIGTTSPDPDYKLSADGGFYSNNAIKDGVHIVKAGNPSSTQWSPYICGFEVEGAEGHGIFIGHADYDGIYINHAEDMGINVWDAGLNGVSAHAANIGVYANTGASNHEWGFYTPDKIFSSYVTSQGNSTYAKNTGTSTLEPGDIVCIAGGAEEKILDEAAFSVIHVELAEKNNSQAVFGVVEYRVAMVEKPEGKLDGKTREMKKRFAYANGNVSPGDYLSVVVFGQAEVKVNSSANIQSGQKLTVSDSEGKARVLSSDDSWANTGILGKALENSNGKNKIKVFVNCK